MSGTLFEVTPDDIAKLDPVQLRELIAKLAQAVVQARGHSVTTVSWGGEQTAPDGGFDVVAELPAGAGYCAPSLPRNITGYQVKKYDMTAGKVDDEMRPKGLLRPELEKLAEQGGAYIIVSSGTNTSAGMLTKRRQAMEAAMAACPHSANLYLDFFDRRRIADWVAEHAGMVLWVRERVGRALDGWKPYGNWSETGATVQAAFIPDDRARVHMGQADAPDIAVFDAIHKLREMLATPGAAVRLVGLSGVGKTRLVQALFEDGVGNYPLPQDVAIYADGGRTPHPEPVAMASNLVAERRRAILVVDNCGAALHKELTKTCKQEGSTVSLLTVEYDVREDFTVDTEVVTIAAASDALITELLRRRYPMHSPEDRSIISEASGGNARIALAIASTLGQTGSLGRLADRDLFGRLFWQRGDGGEDKDLLNAAMASSLVYSFSIDETLDGSLAALPRLAALTGQTTERLYQHIATLEERQLIQTRGNWRAVLPHALANYLADRALKQFLPSKVLAHLVDGASAHLKRSLVRRLSYLPANSQAQQMCATWLAESAILGDPLELDNWNWDMFENAATVAPEAALQAIERCADALKLGHFSWSKRLANLLRFIAYDASLFERTAGQLLRIAIQPPNTPSKMEAYKALIAFFFVVRSGTHASATVKFALIKSWLDDANPRLQHLGLDALRETLAHRSAHWYGNSLGARQRDDGWRPANEEEYKSWYQAAMQLALAQLALIGPTAEPARAILASSFPHLWNAPSLHTDLENTMQQAASGGFWLEGWRATIEARRFCHADQALLARLKALEDLLAPSKLADEVVAFLFQPRRVAWRKESGLSLEEWYAQDLEFSRQFGVRVASQLDLLPELLPRLTEPSEKTESFGRGIGDAAANLQVAWNHMQAGWRATPADKRNDDVMKGFIEAAAQRDGAMVNDWLDAGTNDSDILPIVPSLSVRAGLDRRAMERIANVLDLKTVPLHAFSCLRAAITAPAEVLAIASILVARLAKLDPGVSVASWILGSWLTRMDVEKMQSKASLAGLCREVLSAAQWRHISEHDDYILGEIAQVGLVGAQGEELAFILARALRDHGMEYPVLYIQKPEVFKALLEMQAGPALSGLFDDGDDESISVAVSIFQEAADYPPLPKSLIEAKALLQWCSSGPARRFDIAAQIVPLLTDPDGGHILISDSARQILEAAPDPVTILDCLADRMSPRIWSGSRALIIEAKAAALFDLAATMHDGKFQEHVRQLKAKFSVLVKKEVEDERTKRERSDESFE